MLVGGQGTRLRPLTARRHKSLVPLLNRPAIEYLFDWLERSGFERVVLAIGRDNDDLAAAYPPGRRGSMEFALVQERERLESGGAIRHAVHAAGIEGRFAVLNGDVFVDFEFAGMLEAHTAVGARLSQYLYPVSEPWRFGVAAVDRNSMITGFVEKPARGEEPGNLINAGVWLFEPDLLDAYPTGAVRVEETLFPSLVARGQPVLGYTAPGTWADIGTPPAYLALSRELVAQRGNSVVDERSQVAPDASILQSVVGPDGRIGAGVSVVDSLLWEGVVVGEEATIAGSILADGVVVGEGAILEGVVAGSGAVIAPGARLSAGTSIDAGARYDADND